MLKEEKELRKLVFVCPAGCEHCKQIRKAITALVRAVREDCAKVAEGEMQQGTNSAILAHNTSCSQVAAAIRGRK